uniref:UDP-glycosyltransferases domain-containing protein n=1 Tax=Alexandrium monilatum TaxID=311494 RepID=A0A7S4T206_9DINO|mmetsp:Transcript_3618/g.11561  ORF Transcript_3618/g.11561 Transcript_3618/m.11561 type:complete len:508 (-) Transcript_3618:21-1544(-)
MSDGRADDAAGARPPGGKAARVFLFVFPKMPGDVNPSFPVARRLVGAGHSVYYLSPDYRAAIEDTGATFLDATEYYDLFKEGRTPETFGAANQLRKELDFPQSDGEYVVRVKIANVELEKKIEGVLRAIRETGADTIVYDPVLNREAPPAAEIAKVAIVALLCFNGHGAWADVVRAKMKNDLPSIESEEERIKEFERASKNEHNVAATERLNAKYVPMGMTPLDGCFTGGRLDPVPKVCLVTTTEALKNPETPDLVGGSRVVYPGVLLDVPGALRAGGPTSKDLWKKVEAAMDERREGGKIVFVSMGTVTTADGPLGWQGKPNSSLTGEQLSQAVWGAAFDALGGEQGSGNVILATVGKDASGAPRPLAAGDAVPGNAFCSPSMPQVDILAKGIDLFVTHGGQNSFVEAITQQTPVLVVPTVGDQIDNAGQAVRMGIGEKVDRPLPSDADPAQVAADYRGEVKCKLLAMLADLSSYKAAVVKARSSYRGGGVDEAVAVLSAPPGHLS